jgi:hypothetical protein
MFISSSQINISSDTIVFIVHATIAIELRLLWLALLLHH